MKILVAGGAGYIGSHAVLALLERGDEVVVFDNFEYGHKDALERIVKSVGVKSSNLYVYDGDLRNSNNVTECLETHKGIEAAIDFAAYIQAGESVKDPSKYYYNNVYGSLNLIDCLSKNAINKIVFSSTAAVYGDPERIPIKETDRQIPINPYGNTKFTVERILEDFHTAYGMNSVRLRYFNAAGASTKADIGEDHEPETHVIPIALEVALEQRDKMMLFGEDYETEDGTCIRDYIHVEDLISAHLLALDKLNEEGNVCDYFNLGTEGGVSNREIIEKCKEVTGVDFKVEITERRPGDPAKLIADSTKAKEVLGWIPKHSLDDIVRSAWRWHKDNPGGYPSEHKED